MELCSNNHDEVCFDGRDCPVCDIRYDLEKKISDFEDEIFDLKEQLQS